MINLLFGYQGRINRAQYWLGSIAVGICGLMMLGLMLTLSGGADLENPQAAAQALGGLLFGALGVITLAAWCQSALQVKRFHDRGRSGWLAAIPAALGGLSGLLAVASPLAAIGLAPIILAATVIVNIWFFIDLGCMPGVAGPNRFGNPPGSPSAPSAPTSGSARSAADAVLKPTPSTLSSAEAAMERAIADRARQPQIAPKAGAAMSAPSPARPSPHGPAPSFGRRAVTR